MKLMIKIFNHKMYFQLSNIEYFTILLFYLIYQYISLLDFKKYMGL
jgi:hypothetical protein